MSLKSSSKVDTNRVQLEVSVDADAFEKAVDQAYRKEKGKIAIPGFRKGKAPRKFVEKYYGEKIFYDDAVNAVYPGALQQAIREANIEMVEDKIDFDVVSAGKEGLVFKATVTTKPEAKIEGYKGLAVAKKRVEATDADVNAEIDRVRDRNARMVSVEDREAQKGDIVDIDFDGRVGGKPFAGGKAENYSLVLGAGQFVPGFEDQVIGHKSGEEFDVKVTFPKDYQAKDLAGKDAVFKVKLHEIKKKELPGVDDDFVKDVSDFDTLDEYKADIRKKILEAREKAAKDEVDNQLIDKLVSLLQAEIPEAMFRNQIDDDLRDFSYRLQTQGMNLQNYMKYTGLDDEGVRKQFRPQAERQVKLRLALEKIAELEKIQPSDGDVESEYKKIAESYKTDMEKVKKAIPRENIAKDLGVEKAFGLVRDSAVVTEAEPAQEKPAGEGKDGKAGEKAEEKAE
ncbi:MAG TPA: trigger factor [Ruminococcaceae bacterium]|jgi:trigger factor|nr:trigger factor [Oscillospiraceae bacterium]